MKKTLLLTVAIALMAMVFFGCQNQVQPISGDIVTKPDSAPAVAGDKIKAEAFDGGILVSWEAANETAGYYVYRQEVKDNSPQEGTTVRVSSYVNHTTNKRIPYYWDTGIANGVVYRYGIVNEGYKAGYSGSPVSDIIWQSEDKYATGKGKLKQGEKVKKDLPTFPSATFTPVQTSHPGTTIVSGDADTPEQIVVKITGMTYGYSYTFYGNYVSSGGATAAESAWTSGLSSPIAGGSSPINIVFGSGGGSSSSDPIVDLYLEEGNFEFSFSTSPGNFGGPSGSSTYTTSSYTGRAGRLVAEITAPSSSGYYVEVTNPGATEVLNSNQKVISGTTYLTF